MVRAIPIGWPCSNRKNVVPFSSGIPTGVTKTKTLENEDLRPKTRSSFSYYENEDPVKQKAVEMRSSTHIKQQQGLVI